MFKHLIILLIFTVFIYGCHENDDIKNDAQQIAKFHELAKNNNNDSTLIYINSANRLIKANKNLADTLLIENLFRKGFYYKQIGLIDSATIYYHKTTDLIQAPNNRKRNSIYFRHAWLNDEENSRYANAISLAEKFIDISDENKDYEDLVFAYNLLERLYYDVDDLEKKMYYNAKAIKAARESSNLGMFIISVNSKADLLYKLGEKEEAYRLLDSLSTIKTNNLYELGETYRNHGTFYYKDKKYKLAVEKYILSIEKHKKALQYYSDNTNNSLIELYNYIAASNIELKEYKVAKQFLDSAKAIITNNSFPEYVLYNKELRLKLNYKINGSIDEFISEYDKLVKDNKKELNEHLKEELNALIVANEKEKQAIQAKNKADLKIIKLMALLGFLGLLLILGYLFYRHRRHKFEKQELQMQQRLLRAQMNPHFMFNTLSVIQNQIKVNQEHAAKYLLKFSRLLRLILENSLNNYVQIENELESLRKYIDLQLLRFPEKFTYTIVCKNLEEDELLFIPPMLIQPFIENSIEHGFVGIKNKGQINIILTLFDKWIECTIEDNGRGINYSNNSYKKSVSTKLISQFIHKTTKNKISILDKKTMNKETSGVLIKFYIPYKFSKND